MPCVPTFTVRPHPDNGFVIIAAWPKGHVEQLVGVFDTSRDAEVWLGRYSADFIDQVGPPSRRVVQLDAHRK